MIEAPEMQIELEAPKLLVEWSSPWEEFRSAWKPALGRSAAKLAGEAHTGIFPYRGILVTWAGEILLLIAAIVLPGKLAMLQPTVLPQKPNYDVIYFSPDELPQTQDVGGARSGTSGRAGGHEAFHRTQTIKVARGDSTADKVVDAPTINLPKSDAPVMNLLAVKGVPGPPPAEGLKSSLPRLPNAATVPPPPSVGQGKLRAAPSLSSNAVAPPPTLQNDVAGVRVPTERVVDVVPPPVSAPTNPTSPLTKLSLPQPSVIAPPPSVVTREMTSLTGSQLTDFQKQIVPPPVQVSGHGTSGREAPGTMVAANAVVPPPVQVSGGGGRQGPGAFVGSNDVVPPPPSVNGGTSEIARGRGTTGYGLGGANEVGSVLAPPTGGGGTGNSKTGVIVSSNPGSAKGVPGNGGGGSLAMSPAGGAKSGVGGTGGGNGIGTGNGPGSGLSGEGSGAGKTGTGKGSDVNARGGISPYPGPGGTGNATRGSTTPGVSVRGGNTSTIDLPSFGGSGNGPDAGTRSSVGKGPRGPGISIEATPRSGGALNMYGALQGDKVYSIYIPTAVGTAILQYADPTSGKRSYAYELTAPEVLRTDLPASAPHSRLIIACVLDRNGVLRNVHVLEPRDYAGSTKILAALPGWKFRPAQRGEQPVEVNAILGFNVDTR